MSARTKAKIGKGTTFEMGDVGGSGYVFIEELIDFKPPARKAGKAEATRYDSDAEEFIPGWESSGDAEFEVNDTDEMNALLEPVFNTMRSWRATTPLGRVVTFEGFITDDSLTTPRTKAMTKKIKITVTDKVDID